MKLPCFQCEKKTLFEIEGNVKICQNCKRKFSHKYDSSHIRHRTHERQTNTNYSGEKSPYWDWASQAARISDSGEYKELPQANPDYLPEENTLYKQVDSDTQEQFSQIMKHIDKLTQKQKKIVQLLWDGKTFGEIATILGVSKGSVQKTIERVRKRFQKCLTNDENQPIG